jgi:hypothetical protein
VNKGGICALLRQPIDARNKANKKRWIAIDRSQSR